jgi:hypothetical protein
MRTHQDAERTFSLESTMRATIDRNAQRDAEQAVRVLDSL